MDQRTCPVCDQPLPATAPENKRYCGAACWQKQYRAKETRNCSVEGCTNRLRAKGLCSTHYNQQDPNRHASTTCNDPEARRLGWLAHHKRRRAQLRGASTEVIHRKDIAERDGWTCWLCHKPVDPDTAWPDLMCASLDHVVPLSCGGDHTRANVRLAHFRCNVARGNRPHGEQLRLIG